MARRATVIKDVKKKVNEVLLLDAGNLFFKGKGSPSSIDRDKALLIARAYKRMGYQAVNIGSDDLLAGIEFLKKLQKGTHFPFLSANLLNREAGKTIFKSHMIVDLGGVRVGLFGLTSDMRQNEGVTPEGYFISDPIAAAKKAADKLANECDVIVALSNLGSIKEHNNLVQQVNNIHFIIGSGGKRIFHQTIRSDKGWKAFLFRGHSKGQYLGRIDLKGVKGSRKFVDLRQKANLERQVKHIERQLDSYRRGTGRSKSIPQDKREEHIKRLEQYKKRTEARLKEMEGDSRGNSTFLHTTISLNQKVNDDPKIKDLVNKFKKRH